MVPSSKSFPSAKGPDSGGVSVASASEAVDVVVCVSVWSSGLSKKKKKHKGREENNRHTATEDQK